MRKVYYAAKIVHIEIYICRNCALYQEIIKICIVPSSLYMDVIFCNKSTENQDFTDPLESWKPEQKWCVDSNAHWKTVKKNHHPNYIKSDLKENEQQSCLLLLLFT